MADAHDDPRRILRADLGLTALADRLAVVGLRPGHGARVAVIDGGFDDGIGRFAAVERSGAVGGPREHAEHGARAVELLLGEDGIAPGIAALGAFAVRLDRGGVDRRLAVAISEAAAWLGHGGTLVVLVGLVVGGEAWPAHFATAVAEAIASARRGGVVVILPSGNRELELGAARASDVWQTQPRVAGARRVDRARAAAPEQGADRVSSGDGPSEPPGSRREGARSLDVREPGPVLVGGVWPGGRLVACGWGPEVACHAWARRVPVRADGRWIGWSGTSAAAVIVAGLAAAMRGADPSGRWWSPAEVEAALGDRRAGPWAHREEQPPDPDLVGALARLRA